MGPLLSSCAFFSKIQNPVQSCQPSTDLKDWKIWKWSKDFKKVGPIRGNLSYNSQCLDFLRDLTQKMPEIYCVFFQDPDQSCRSSIDLKNWKIWKLGKDFKKVGPIRGNWSYGSWSLKIWAVLSWNLPKTLRCKIQILAKSPGLA